MASPIEYQSGIDRAEVFKPWRRRGWKIAFATTGVLAIAIFALVGEWIYHDTHLTIDTDVTISNHSALPIDGAGFFSIIDERVGSLGPISPGQTVKQHLRINEDLCPCDFVFEQGGQTFYVPLAGPDADDQTSHDITISPGSFTATVKRKRQPTTLLTLIPVRSQSSI